MHKQRLLSAATSKLCTDTTHTQPKHSRPSVAATPARDTRAWGARSTPQRAAQLAAKRSTTVKDLAISSSRGRTLPQRRSLAPVTSV